MKVTAIKTPKITNNSIALTDLLDTHITNFSDGDILVITSKIVSLCQGDAVPIGSIDKDKLLIREADQYLPSELSKYGHHFTIKNHTLIASAGIDESNADNHYVLWPADPQATANQVREYLCDRFDIQNAGVIITDSTCQPLRRGTTGICLAHSGFLALNNYIGKSDLFNHQMRFTFSSISGGLAAAAVVCMGEGAEQTPLAIISDVSFVTFQQRNPNDAELADLHIPVSEDLFAPFLESVAWQQGDLASQRDAQR